MNTIELLHQCERDEEQRVLLGPVETVQITHKTIRHGDDCLLAEYLDNEGAWTLYPSGSLWTDVIVRPFEREDATDPDWRDWL